MSTIDRQATTCNNGSQQKNPSKSSPSPHGDLCAAINEIILSLSPDTLRILSVEFSKQIRCEKRAESPEHASEPVNRYRIRLALIRLTQFFNRELTSGAHCKLILDAHHGLRVETHQHRSQYNASFIISIIRDAMCTPRNAASEIWLIIAKLLFTEEIRLNNLRVVHVNAVHPTEPYLEQA